MPKSLFIGLLSGTSMDAIDVALASFDPTPKLFAKLNYPIPPSFKKRCLEITTTGNGNIDEYCQLDTEAGEIFANAVNALLNQNNISAQSIRAIGSHGQTIRHCPDNNPAFTLQIGNPSVIFERTGILTVADFRRADIAAGGQGAPLAPLFHAHAFPIKDPKETRIIVNIGGISNITLLKPSSRKYQDQNQSQSQNLKPSSSIIGFDTGPGNCLMDSFVLHTLGLPFDENGTFAAKGLVHQPLLRSLLSDPFFLKTPPKSTGREYFNLNWLYNNPAFNTNISPEDVQATLLQLTTTTIANAITSALAEDDNPYSVYVCGGGAKNIALMNALSHQLKCPVRTTDALGIAPDWVEAVLFAWLAKQTLEGHPGNCPSVTGAKKAVTLGGIFGFSKEQCIL